MADLNKDCVIRASELGTYLKEIVPKDLNFSQTSLFNRIGGEGEFLFIPPICRPIAPEELQPPKPDAAWEKSDAYKRTKSLPYKSPSQLAIDRQNALYVLDSERQAIYKFDAAGTATDGQLRPGREAIARRGMKAALLGCRQQQRHLGAAFIRRK